MYVYTECINRNRCIYIRTHKYYMLSMWDSILGSPSLAHELTWLLSSWFTRAGGPRRSASKQMGGYITNYA